MTTHTPTLKQIASGLRFPEGPVAMPDGSVILVEIERRTLSRVTSDGKISHVIGGVSPLENVQKSLEAVQGLHTAHGQ